MNAGLVENRAVRWPLYGAGVLVAWIIFAATLPRGVPPGIVLQGLVLGSLTGLTAMGLVLIYRSARIVNFAQAEIGVLASTVGIVMVAGFKLPYVVAAPVGLVAAVLTGLVVDLVVVRRLFDAPRLILTVATVGVFELLGALESQIPTWFKHNLTQLTRFKTPFSDSLTFYLRPYRFDGNSVLALVLVPVVLVAVAWFLGRSDTGIAIRAAADSGERALLLGIPVRRLSQVTWMVAAGLSGLAALLQAPIVGPELGGVGGATALLPALAAAVAARMDSLPKTLLAAMGIQAFMQTVFWNYSQSHTVDVALFGIVIVALLVQRKHITRVDDGGLGGYVAVREVRPIPAILRDLPEVRWARIGGAVALLLAVVGLPWTLTNSRLIILGYVCLYSIVAVSLVVLTGWAGQISFGQFAFVGVGAGVAGALLVHAGADLVVATLLGSIAGAVAAVVVGIPALRIKGLFLAVATLAFAVPVSTYLLNHAYFPTLTPQQVEPPVLLERFPLASNRAFYYFALGVLAVVVILARNFRRSRAGRAVVAVRDNERAAAGFGISPVRAKLVAFTFSGALAGAAGGLYVVAQRGIGFSGFDPDLSLAVFTAVVVGGLGSIPGALLGAFFVEEAQTLHGGLSFLATGAGLLFVLLFLPGGIGDVVYRIRDAGLRGLARAKGLSVPSLIEQPGAAGFTSELDDVGDQPVTVLSAVDAPLVRCEGIDAGYGQIQVLFDVGIDVADGEILALLGTNGAGKSTVLRVIAGLLRPSKGRVFLDGRDVTDLSPAERVRAGLVTVPGGRGVFVSLTVAEHLRLAGWLFRKEPEFLAACERRVLELFPTLEDRLGVRGGQLSGGEQQMLTLAQALYCRPRLLLIDELSLGLAPVVVAALLDAVRQINAAGTAVVVVEQSTNVAANLAERAVFMEKGQVRFSGPTAGLLERPDLLRSVFLRHNGAAASRRRPAPARPEGGAVPRMALHQVGYRYGVVNAIDGVDLEVREGEIVGIIGSNGAGKTTLLDLCSGFLTTTRGRVELDGHDVTSLGASERADLGLGRSFQDARLFPSLTVTEAIATALERHVDVRDPLLCIFRTGGVVQSEEAVAARVDELVEEMGLTRYRDAFISELSTGTRRIVELACAMAHEPRVLLLDEPSSGIAQRESEALGELLLRVRTETGAALVVVEHDIPLVSSIADRLVCLDLGSVLSEGPPSTVLSDPLVVASYLGTDPAAVARSGNVARRRPRSAPSKPAVVAGAGDSPRS